MYHAETIDVAVIGGGHAGCEAALASARLGMNTVMFAISLDSIALMPCNPSIGGSSKGHLVREIDALGGEMGKVIDQTYIQTKMLNTGKGPAVYCLRARADKIGYQVEMKHRLENTPSLKIKQAEIVDILMEDGKVSGVVTSAGAVYECKAVVLCMGTYMKARCLTGEHITESGPNNLMPATKLSAKLKEMGVDLFRFKTGTPARMNKNSLNLDKMQPQYGDEDIVPFSFENKPEDIEKPQALCYLTYTYAETHRIKYFPAAYPTVFAVGSLNAEESKISDFSQRGEWVDVYYCGEEVNIKTLSGSSRTSDGTSYSAAAVTALAANIIHETNGVLTPSELRQSLIEKAEALSDGTRYIPKK